MAVDKIMLTHMGIVEPDGKGSLTVVAKCGAPHRTLIGRRGHSVARYAHYAHSWRVVDCPSCIEIKE